APAAVRVGQRVVQQIIERATQARAIDGDERQVGRGVYRQRNVLVLGPWTDCVGGRFEQVGRLLGSKVERAVPPFQFGQVQKIVDHPEQALGAVAGIQQQLGLLRRQGTDGLL